MVVLLVFTDVFEDIVPLWRYGIGLLILIYAVFRIYRKLPFRTENNNNDE